MMNSRYIINAEDENISYGAITIIGNEMPPPPGHLLCDGSELSCESYPELFNILSDTYGGNLDSVDPTFALPDFRGQTLGGVVPKVVEFTPEDDGIDECYLDRIGVSDE